MPSSGVCTGVPVYISTEEFYIDLFMHPLHDYELVLGCHWLKTLGPILWDLEHRYMVFWCHNHLRAMSYLDLLQLLLAEFGDVFHNPSGLLPS